MLRFVDKLVEATAALCLAASALMICTNVLRRYVILEWLRGLAERWETLLPVFVFLDDLFARPGAVAEEVPGLLLVWIAFLGAYLVQRREGHICFEVLTNWLPRLPRWMVAAVVRILLLLLFALIFAQSLRMIWIDGATEIETADIAQGWFMMVMPLAALLLALALVAGERERRDRARQRQ